MCEILIKVETYTHTDPVKDRMGVHKKGDIISIKPDGWSDHPNWGQSAYPYQNTGKFVTIKCPEVTVAQAEEYANAWKDEFDYEIVATRAAQGEYDVRVFEKLPGPTGANNMTAAKVETFLANWGCTAISTTTNSVAFTFSLWNAVRSEEFWNTDLTGITFTLVSYASGIGRISVDYSATSHPAKIVEDAITKAGGTVVSTTGKVTVFNITRTTILQTFRDDLKRKAQQVYKRHRYSLPEVDVDAVIAAGGIKTYTKAELIALIKDHTA